MLDWIDTLAAVQRDGQPAVVVTVAGVKGSAPRQPGTKMLVTATAVHGTIGGGHLEFTAIDIARQQLAGGADALLRRFPLGASLGQCCGGVVNLLFEPVATAAGWVAALAALRARGGPVVVVMPAHGAAQREKLFVTPEVTLGTLGSAARDAAATARARELLAGPAEPGMARLPGGDAGASGRGARGESADRDGTVAGGRAGSLAGDGTGAVADAEYFFDPVLPPDFMVVLFGAGHVGRALAQVLAGLPCHLTWVDSRDDAFPAPLPANATAVVTDAPEAEVAAASAGSYFLVMTHSHPLDEALSAAILRRGDFAYFGLIGSVSKRRQFERRLGARGVAPERLAAMTCPIGAAGIAGKEPGIIAVAVAAQLLQRRAAVRAALDGNGRGLPTAAAADSVIVATGTGRDNGGTA